MPSERSPEKRAELNAIKEEKARDRIIAMQEYQTRQTAMLENMARLRELRLAKEAAERPLPEPKRRSRKKLNS